MNTYAAVSAYNDASDDNQLSDRRYTTYNEGGMDEEECGGDIEDGSLEDSERRDDSLSRPDHRV
jgi:hypothetical protein